MAIGIDNWKAHWNGLCDGCEKGKQNRKQFTHITPTQRIALYSSMNRLSLVHTDVVGPISPPTIGRKCEYLWVLVDEKSYKVWGYLLKHKNETADYLPKWIQMVERETGEQVVIIHSDGGSEFLGRFQEYLKHHGIKHRTTPLHP